MECTSKKYIEALMEPVLEDFSVPLCTTGR